MSSNGGADIALMDVAADEFDEPGCGRAEPAPESGRTGSVGSGPASEQSIGIAGSSGTDSAKSEGFARLTTFFVAAFGFAAFPAICGMADGSGVVAGTVGVLDGTLSGTAVESCTAQISAKVASSCDGRFGRLARVGAPAGLRFGITIWIAGLTIGTLWKASLRCLHFVNQVSLFGAR